MRPNEVNGTKTVKFRVSPIIYNILKEASSRAGVSLSEFVRAIVYYYLNQTLLETIKNEKPKTLREIEEEIARWLNEKK